MSDNNTSAEPSDHSLISVLVTRPAHQSAGFVNRLQNSGFTSVCLPSIAIDYTTTDLAEAFNSDLMIFTSANSVTGVDRINSLPLKTHARIAAIGNATRQALERLNVSVDIVPAAKASSEALLDAITNTVGDVANLQVSIIRGDSGRDALHSALTKMGAVVSYVSVYKRSQPDYSKAELHQLLGSGLPDITSVTSDLGLRNLLAIVPDNLKPVLISRPLVVNSERCKQIAIDHGFSATIIVADPPGDEAQMAAINSIAAALGKNPPG